MPSYLFQPRGEETAYSFRIAVPKALQGRYGRRIVKGLGTADPKEAHRKADRLQVHWKAVFDRAKRDIALTLAEVEDAAREYYRASLARMAADAAMLKAIEEDERSWRGTFLKAAEDQLAAQNYSSVRPEIEAIERRLGVEIDPATPSYGILARALLRAQIAALQGRLRFLDGLTSEMPATFLGAEGIDETTLRPMTMLRPIRAKTEHGPLALFQQWIAEARPAVSTVNRWRAVFLSLESKFGQQEITESDASQWIKDLSAGDNPGRSKYTVSNIWLTASRRVYKWALDQKLVPSNPFATVKVTVPKQAVTRSKAFTDAEAKTILTAALAIDPNVSIQAGSRRWCPWLCAYTGARMGEVTQLRGRDILQEDGVWCIKITPEAGTVKSGTYRMVPLHKHLLDQGFVTWAQTRGDGPLFYNPGGTKGEDASNPKRPRAVKCRERLGEWVRSQGVKDKGVRPNHAWRHLWKTIAARAHIPDRMSDTITGHSPATVAGRYEHPTITDMAAALAKFPYYDVMP